ncbi:MAG: 3-deoxy-D-manno-octulosonate 8-phosphate phosphatase [Prosthecochloris sp.]|nr:3-deoxy-D-manno-octulosonate 8-phosphate phosphatase [Prosthecochloris sp.]
MSGLNYFGIQLSTGDSSEILQKALKQVKALIFPVEGVLTGSQITFASSGEEVCSCNVRDVLAVKEAKERGLHIAAISERSSSAHRQLLEHIGIEHIYLGCENKLDAYEEFKADCSLEDEDCAYIADDVIDIPILEKATLSVTPIDGIEYLRNRVSYISGYEGGKGCIREMVELILHEQGKWDYSEYSAM